jgi:ubiquinone/menaquinone biosynthesis C-methylase UbiE
MTPSNDSTYEAFNRDVRENLGYRYTTNARLSSRMANRRLSDVTLKMAHWHQQKVIDIGCGDGTYSIELFQRGRLRTLCGVDPAAEAIAIAQDLAGKTANGAQMSFETQDAYALPYADDSFDLAPLRGVLHHVEDAKQVLKEALRVAPTIVVIEPNGYNPALKLLERVSPYHREHQEKSYAPSQLDAWVESLGATVTKRSYAGLVPFFCPDVMACTLKYFEPLVENLPVARQMSCAVYVFTATRNP